MFSYPNSTSFIFISGALTRPLSRLELPWTPLTLPFPALSYLLVFLSYVDQLSSSFIVSPNWMFFPFVKAWLVIALFKKKKKINIGYLHVEINNPFYLYSFLCKNKTLPAQTYFWHLAPPFIIGRVCLPSWNVKFLQGFISLLCLHVIGVPQVIINASVCNMWIFLCVLHKDRSQGFQFFMKLPNSDLGSFFLIFFYFIFY